VLTDN